MEMDTNITIMTGNLTANYRRKKIMESEKKEYRPPAGTDYPAPTIRRPSQRALEEMVDDGVCATTDGCEVEPDGVCEHGHPSWLLHLGLI